MATYRCRAKKRAGEIDLGYEIQICTLGLVTASLLKKELERLGFNKTTVSSFSAPGYWDIKKVD